MSFTDKLMRSTYPAVIIERWIGSEGWPCFKIFLLTSPSADPVGDGNEYEHVQLAREAAATLADRMLPAACAIVDMTKDS